jgi:hypothetical protein
MSASPDLVHAMSRWLAGHIADEELGAVVAAEDQPEAAELREALERGESRPELERIVRETLQDVAAA